MEPAAHSHTKDSPDEILFRREMRQCWKPGVPVLIQSRQSSLDFMGQGRAEHCASAGEAKMVAGAIFAGNTQRKEYYKEAFSIPQEDFLLNMEKAPCFLEKNNLALFSHFVTACLVIPTFSVTSSCEYL